MDGDSNSIKTQKEILGKYAREHGLFNVEFYVDDGYSGTNFNRPDFQRMLKDIESGAVGTVIVKDMSRFGKNYIMVGYYTDVLFTNGRIKSKTELKQSVNVREKSGFHICGISTF